MKVYIVLEYLDFEGITESCRIDRLYTTRKQANKRKHLRERLEARVLGYSTFHVIEKSLKGKL